MTQCSGWQSPGWSNPNLLINWDFRNPVNQRGQTSYATGNNYIYTVDMVTLRNGTVNIVDGLINFVSTKDNLYKRIVWKFEKLKKGTYTMSALLKRNVIYGGVRLTLSNNASFGQEYIMLKKITEQEAAEMEYVTKTFTIESDNEAPAIEIVCNNTTVDYCDIDIYAVKLEVGSISTLAIDLMQPSDYAAELRKCQWYLQVLNGIVTKSARPIVAIGVANGVDRCLMFLPWGTNMRKTPTISKIGALKLYDGQDSIEVINISTGFTSSNGVCVDAYTETALTIGKTYYLRMDGTDTNIILSAEL